MDYRPGLIPADILPQAPTLHLLYWMKHTPLMWICLLNSFLKYKFSYIKSSDTKTNDQIRRIGISVVAVLAVHLFNWTYFKRRRKICSWDMYNPCLPYLAWVSPPSQVEEWIQGEPWRRWARKGQSGWRSSTGFDAWRTVGNLLQKIPFSPVSEEEKCNNIILEKLF